MIGKWFLCLEKHGVIDPGRVFRVDKSWGDDGCSWFLSCHLKRSTEELLGSKYRELTEEEVLIYKVARD